MFYASQINMWPTPLVANILKHDDGHDGDDDDGNDDEDEVVVRMVVMMVMLVPMMMISCVLGFAEQHMATKHVQMCTAQR